MGRELARQLVASTVEVHGFSRRASGESSIAKQVVLHQLDGSTETLIRLFGKLKPDTVIHLAALARRHHESLDIVPFIEANIRYGAQLLEAMRNAQCGKFVTAESVLQYSETGEDRPLNFYAATKRAFAGLLRYYVEEFNLHAMAIVLPTVYREWETAPKLMLLAERLWSNPKEYAQSWNFGPAAGGSRPVRWIVEKLIERWGVGVPWKLDDAPTFHEASTLTLDSTKARVSLGWKPRWTLDQTSQESVLPIPRK